MLAFGFPSLTTSQEDWERSDKYHNSFLIADDPVLEAVEKNNHEHGLPDIAVSAAQGKFLNLLAQSINAKRILEVGTLGGFSTIWLARALPDDCSLVTLELSEKFAKESHIFNSIYAFEFNWIFLSYIQVARENIANAGLADKTQVIVGPAVESLATLQPNPPFDLVFIDANKPENVAYFTEAKRLVRKGGIIIVDNVVLYAYVANPTYVDDNVEGVRRLLQVIKSDTEVEATTISTVGEKGYDGFLYAIRK